MAIPNPQVTLDRSKRLAYVKGEAYWCRLFHNILATVLFMHRHMAQESGKRATSIRRYHRPRAVEKSLILQQLIDGINPFLSGVDTESPEAFEEQEKRLTAAVRLRNMFERGVVKVLRKGQANEKAAAAALRRAKATCLTIRAAALDELRKQIGSFESAACEVAVFTTTPAETSVSVASLDLAKYGKHIEGLNAHLKSEGVFGLNRVINKLIAGAIKDAQVPKKLVLMIETGDGALVVFKTKAGQESAQHAVAFVAAFYERLKKWNEELDSDSQLHFRTGISSGEIMLSETQLLTGQTLAFTMGGVCVGTAVRLQSAAKTGEFIACNATYKASSDAVSAFGPKAEDVKGKEHEKRPIPAVRCRVIDPHPEENTAFKTKESGDSGAKTSALM